MCAASETFEFNFTVIKLKNVVGSVYTCNISANDVWCGKKNSKWKISYTNKNVRKNLFSDLVTLFHEVSSAE